MQKSYITYNICMTHSFYVNTNFGSLRTAFSQSKFHLHVFGEGRKYQGSCEFSYISLPNAAKLLEVT